MGRIFVVFKNTDGSFQRRVPEINERCWGRMSVLLGTDKSPRLRRGVRSVERHISGQDPLPRLHLLSVYMHPQKSPISLWAHQDNLQVTCGAPRERATDAHRRLIPPGRALCRPMLSGAFECSCPSSYRSARQADVAAHGCSAHTDTDPRPAIPALA